MNKKKKNQRKKNKRKKATRNKLRGDNNRSGAGDDTSIIFDDDTLCNILSRLSVKTLMRFKCVCKRWCSLIQKDEYLIDSHFTRSKNNPNNKVLFISLPSDENSLSDEDHGLKTILFSYLVQGRIINRWKLDLDCPGSVKILKPVNGLVCFCQYDSNSVLIFNPSTGERTSWIESPTYNEILIEGRIIRASSYYGFGFDPTTNEHKVIRVWKIFRLKKSSPDLIIDNNDEDEKVCRFCEVLIVGENRWRRIDEEVPPFQFATCQYASDSIYANGSIYWRFRGEFNEMEVLVAFDVGKEKFRVIPIPDFVIDPLRYKFSQTIELMELDGRIALVKWESEWLVTLWKFNDDNKGNTTTSSDDSEWTEEESICEMPTMWNGKPTLWIEAIAGTDLLILCQAYSEFHYYTRKKNIYEEFDIAYEDIKGLRWITNFVESLLPVQKHHSSAAS